MLRKQKIALAALGALLVTGCATPVKVVINSKFDANEAKSLMEPGKNTVKGSALIRQQGGGVVTCAGLPIWLFPATAYAKERISYLYKSVEGGHLSFRTMDNRPTLEFVPTEPQYDEIRRQSICDAQGFFKFDQVADGTFYVWTYVQWYIDSTKQGGALLKKVSVSNGEVKEIVLAP